jgi:PIN domain nuclease of toxin-antitoxin system
VRLLLDTHFLIWLATDASKIRRTERVILADPDNDLYVSVLSVWEVRLKWNALDRAGRRKGTISPEAAIAYAQRQKLQLAALNPEDVAVSLEPPLSYRDPFDEMLLVHAGRLDAKLLTRDRLLADHSLALQL